jgi:uncharacterized repeat protein (TIGR03803 family)
MSSKKQDYFDRSPLHVLCAPVKRSTVRSVVEGKSCVEILEPRILLTAVNLKVPYYYQFDSPWCAPTSISMELGYFGYNRKPWQVAADLGLDSSNGVLFADWPTTVPTYLNKYYTNSSDTSLPSQWSEQTIDSSLSGGDSAIEASIEQSLLNGSPVLLGSASAGHAIVVTGFDDTAGTVTFNDPSGALFESSVTTAGSGVLEGLVHQTVSWSSFLEQIHKTFLGFDYSTVYLVYATVQGQPSTSGITEELGPSTNDPGYAAITGANHLTFNSGSTSLQMSWNGASPYPGYEYTPIGSNSAYIIADSDSSYPNFGNDATQDDTLSFEPSIGNYSADSRSVKTIVEVENAATGAVVQSLDSTVDGLSPGVDTIPAESFAYAPAHSDLSFPLSGFNPGTYQLDVKVEDASTNVVLDENDFYFGVAANPTVGKPTVSINPPSSSSVSVSSIGLTGTAVDSMGDLTSLAWVDNLGGGGSISLPTNSSDEWAVEGIALSQGVNTITVSATDEQGQTGSAATTITYAPTIILAAPTLLFPGNSSSDQSTSPTFKWDGVPGNLGYRIFVTTDPSLLPTDPNDAGSPSGGSVAINQTVAQDGVLYPSSGLAANTTYYWEMHALGISSGGTWSGASTFTTAPATPSLSITSVSPSSFALPTGQAQLITISGTGFDSSDTLVLSDPNAQAHVISPASVSATAITFYFGFTETGQWGVGVSNGNSSAGGQFTVTAAGSGQSAEPTISPNGGAFTSAQTVYLSDSTPGVAIHYTLDGSVPTIASPTYTNSFVVSSTTTVQAIAIGGGYNPSPVASATFAIGESTGGIIHPSATSVSVGSGQGGALFDITNESSFAFSDWSATSSQSWLSLYLPGGVSLAPGLAYAFQFATSPNPTSYQRTATITFSVPGSANVYVGVTQAEVTPSIASFSTSTPSVYPGQLVTLSSSSLTPVGAPVYYFLESNGIPGLQTGPGGDTQVGEWQGDGTAHTVQSPSPAPGPYTYYAAVEDSYGNWSTSGTYAPSVTVTVVPPTITSITASSSVLSESQSLTLTANMGGPGFYGWVTFYLDSNDIPGLNESFGPAFIPYQGSTATLQVNAPHEPGSYTVYAVAQDNYGNSSATGTDAPSTTVTVTGPPTVTTNPHSQLVFTGTDATFTADVTGTPTPSVQWQVSTDGGNAFNDMPGETQQTLDIGNATLNETGNKYRAVFSNGIAPDATTFSATLTVLEKAKGSASMTTVASFTNGGFDSEGGVTFDSSGNLWGTTHQGGTNGYGTVFEVAQGSSSVTTVASFNQSNGANPSAGVTFDASGNLWGTTFDGGTDNGEPGNDGTVFEIAKDSSSITTVASFTGGNGEFPNGVTFDADGNLWGTTSGGGGNGDGTVFEIAVGSSSITTVASFTGGNGEAPLAGVTFDASGNLWGTTWGGASSGTWDGVSNLGTVFEIIKGSSSITTVAAFTGGNGDYPSGGVTFDTSGNLWGTTGQGGASGFYGDGTVFEIAHGSSSITTVASFNGSNGAGPEGVTFDASGNLWGTTQGGGANDGTVFEIPKGSSGIITVGAFAGGNGEEPTGMTFDASGNLWGTTYGGGQSGDGTVFELVPAPSPTVTLASPPSPLAYDGTADVTFWVHATVTGTEGNPAPTGVTSLAYFAGTTATGTSLASPPVNAGTYTVVASYSGDSMYMEAESNSVTFSINRVATTTSIAAPPDSITEDGTTDVTNWVQASVTGMPGAPVPSGAITYTYYPGSTATGTPLPSSPTGPGTFTVLASYSGNSNYLPSSASQTFTINAASNLTATMLVNGVVSTGSIANTQRSEISGLVINFSTPVTLSAGTFTLTDEDASNPFGGAGASVPFTLTPSNGGETYTLTFSGSGMVGRGSLPTSLPNGHYNLALNFSDVSSASASVPGGTQTLLFHRLYGDLINAGYLTSAVARSIASRGNWANYEEYLDNDGSDFSNGFTSADSSALTASETFVTGSQEQSLWNQYNV